MNIYLFRTDGKFVAFSNRGNAVEYRKRLGNDTENLYLQKLDKPIKQSEIMYVVTFTGGVEVFDTSDKANTYVKNHINKKPTIHIRGLNQETVGNIPYIYIVEISGVFHLFADFTSARDFADGRAAIETCILNDEISREKRPYTITIKPSRSRDPIIIRHYDATCVEDACRQLIKSRDCNIIHVIDSAAPGDDFHIKRCRIKRCVDSSRYYFNDMSWQFGSVIDEHFDDVVEILSSGTHRYMKISSGNIELSD